MASAEPTESTIYIFVTAADVSRLGDEERSQGRWYDRIRVYHEPTPIRRFRLTVPLAAIQDGWFNPALSEPDNVVESLEVKTQTQAANA